MEGTATVVVTAGVVTYGANATLRYNTATARTTSSEEWIVPFGASGGVIIANTGTITMNVAKVFSASVPLTINSGATLATNNLQLTFGGNFVNGGTLTAGSSPIVITNTMAAQSIDGFTTTGVVLLSKTAGTATFTGNVNGGGLTINGVGGTLNLGTGLTHTFTGTWTRTNGTLNGGSSLLRIGGNVSGTGGTFTAGSGTVEWYAAGAQTCAGVSYNNLIISGSGTKTLGGAATVGGTLTLTSGTFAVAGNTLTLNGPTIAGTPANLSTTATSSLVFGGTTAGVLIPTSVVALNGLSITNTNIVTLQSSLTVSGTFNPAGAGLSIGANTLTLNGIINCGTLVGGATSNIIIGGAGAASLPGVTLNNLTVNRAVTMCGNVTVGGTLTLTSGALSIAANTLTLSDGANLSYGAGSLTGGVTSNLTIGTGSDITLNAIANGLNNFNTSRNITLGADLTVNGTLTLTAGTFYCWNKDSYTQWTNNCRNSCKFSDNSSLQSGIWRDKCRCFNTSHCCSLKWPFNNQYKYSYFAKFAYRKRNFQPCRCRFIYRGKHINTQWYYKLWYPCRRCHIQYYYWWRRCCKLIWSNIK